MNETGTNDNLDKLLSLSNEEMQKLFSQLTVTEIEDLLTKLNEVDHND